jgi:dienelactone hydrolase
MAGMVSPPCEQRTLEQRAGHLTGAPAGTRAARESGALAALGCRRVATIALFHSVLGVRPGLLESAEMLRDHGHTVHVIDQYEGRMFEDYGAALEYVEGVGFPALMAFALGATAELPDRLVTMGFSNGAGMAEYVAGNRQVSGVVMLGGALDPNELGVRWPHGVDGQVHTTVDDPWREQQGIDAVVAAAEGAGGHVEVFDYPGSGHLFADPSKADEFQPAEAELMWSRVLDFLRRMDGVDSPVRTG